MKMQGAYKTQERNWGITGNPESNPTGASGLSRRCAPRSDAYRKNGDSPDCLKK